MRDLLTKQVIEQLGIDDPETLQQTLRDVAEHGASGGVGGFIYYSDTIAFFDRNRQTIMTSVQELANETGIDTLEMIAGFGCLQAFRLTPFDISEAIHTSGHEFEAQVKNALAWYALEEVASHETMED